jgi:hypothetical protein
MTDSYRDDRVLVRASELGPGDLEQLNQHLADAGLGRPLGEPEPIRTPGGPDGPGGLVRIPVQDGDPGDFLAALRARAAAGPVPFPDRASLAGTVSQGVFFMHGKKSGHFVLAGQKSGHFVWPFLAAGKKSGHGLGWVPAPDAELPDPPPWPPEGPSPVIALLDSGVQPHDWLPEPGDGPPFLIDADGLDGWVSPVPADDPLTAPHPPGTHWGHGTFIAGLIRQAAPHAQVLSMRVMDSAGCAADSDVIDALNWLASTDAVRADIVLMAFGRTAQDGDGDPALASLREAVAAVIARGMQVVASAGNEGSTEPEYPAAFAADGLPVFSVGALVSVNDFAPYSNHGPWVHEGWIGTDIISIHPQTLQGAGSLQLSPDAITSPPVPVATTTGRAWWTGTSFAAAIVAGQLASDMPPGLRLPPGAGQP